MSEAPSASLLRTYQDEDGLLVREYEVTSPIGTSLWVRETGTGPCIVLCDGLGCDGYVWKHLWPSLGRTHRVVHLHYRGHGKSEVPSLSLMTVRGLSEDLRAVFAALSIERAVLVGHSMGVQVILEATLRALAGRVSGLVLLCGAAGRPLDSFKNSSLGARAFPWLRALAETYPGRFGRAWTWIVPSRVAMSMARRFEINSDLMDIEDLRPYLARLSVMDPRVFLAMLDDAAQHTVEQELGDVHVPTLVVAAQRDTFTPMYRSVTMAQQIPHADWFVLPEATHTGPLEWPEMLDLRIRRFLRTRVSATASAPPAETAELAASQGE